MAATRPWSPLALGLTLSLDLGLALACRPPVLRQATQAEVALGPCADLVPEATTREAVLLRFGTPTAHFEGEDILTYAFGRQSSGTWTRTRRVWLGVRRESVFQGPGRVANLVLVFHPDGRLRRYSLVVSE